MSLLLGRKTFVKRTASALPAVAAPERLFVVFVVGNLKENFGDLPVMEDEFVGESVERKRDVIVNLHAALKNSNANWAAVLAGGLPLITRDLFQKLTSLRDENSEAAVTIQADEKAQPLWNFHLFRPKSHCAIFPLTAYAQTSDNLCAFTDNLCANFQIHNQFDL